MEQLVFLPQAHARNTLETGRLVYSYTRNRDVSNQRLVCSPPAPAWNTLEKGKLVHSNKRMHDTLSKRKNLFIPQAHVSYILEMGKACIFSTSTVWNASENNSSHDQYKRQLEILWEMNICVTPQAPIWNILETSRLVHSLQTYARITLPTYSPLVQARNPLRRESLFSL